MHLIFVSIYNQSKKCQIISIFTYSKRTRQNRHKCTFAIRYGGFPVDIGGCAIWVYLLTNRDRRHHRHNYHHHHDQYRWVYVWTNVSVSIQDDTSGRWWPKCQWNEFMQMSSNRRRQETVASRPPLSECIPAWCAAAAALFECKCHQSASRLMRLDLVCSSRRAYI